jgi:2-polyprenyl-3-methyl-5-hydroxy-6-metoxy-1,4-benzoquinol methylase
MYNLEWVQDGIKKIQDFIRTNVAWLGIATAASQRVLDYACGHGTISIVSTEFWRP